jgi:beta-1,2-mannobiose phosphorylase / 1,2-beta-oligomannan phosphorylase
VSGHPPDDAEPFTLQRLGVVMEPELGAAEEAWGVLNPAAARGPDGALYLFPRLVAERNYSRIGLARVRFDARGIPTGVERLGIVLEPQEPYELNPLTGGGVEDARITLVQPLQRYVMAYTALGPKGPRVALATSTDLWHWDRLGLVRFAPEAGLDVNAYPNKDASFFPECVVDPHGQPALALLHRPTVPALPTPGALDTPRRSAGSDPRESIWISYVALEPVRAALPALLQMRDHTVLATPQQPWEALKIGAGPPPLRTPLGWLVLYHGVCACYTAGVMVPLHRRYSVGVIVLDGDNVRTTRYRSPRPILAPEQEGERIGIVPNVVFPTGVDTPSAGMIDVYYGMADARIGVARLTLPTTLPGAAGAESVSWS